MQTEIVPCNGLDEITSAIDFLIETESLTTIFLSINDVKGIEDGLYCVIKNRDTCVYMYRYSDDCTRVIYENCRI